MAKYIKLPAGTDDIDTITCTIWVAAERSYFTDTIKLEKGMTELALKELGKCSVKSVGLLPSMRGAGGEAGILAMLILNFKTLAQYAGYINALVGCYRMLKNHIQYQYVQGFNKHMTSVNVGLGIRYLGDLPENYDKNLGARLLEMEVLAEFLVSRLRLEYPNYLYTRSVSVWLAAMNYSLYAKLPYEPSKHTVVRLRKLLLKQHLDTDLKVTFRKTFGLIMRKAAETKPSKNNP